MSRKPLILPVKGLRWSDRRNTQPSPFKGAHGRSRSLTDIYICGEKKSSFASIPDAAHAAEQIKLRPHLNA
jgi:hypothetical protein